MPARRSGRLRKKAQSTETEMDIDKIIAEKPVQTKSKRVRSSKSAKESGSKIESVSKQMDVDHEDGGNEEKKEESISMDTTRAPSLVADDMDSLSIDPKSSNSLPPTVPSDEDDDVKMDGDSEENGNRNENEIDGTNGRKIAVKAPKPTKIESEDDDDEYLDLEAGTLATTRSRRQRVKVSYKDDSSSEEEDESDDEDSQDGNPMFAGLSKAERAAMKAKMEELQNQHSEQARKERDQALEEIISSFEFNIGEKVTKEEAGFIHDFCQKHQVDVNDKIEDEGDFFLMSMREMIEERLMEIKNGIRTQGGGRRGKGGNDSESEFDAEEYDDTDDSEYDVDSDWDENLDHENLISDEDECGGFVVGGGRRRKKGKRRKNVWVGDDGREYRCEGRLLLDDALKDTVNFSGWSAARVKAWKNKSVNPNAYYYRFNDPGEEQQNGRVREDEHQAFMERVMEHGVNSQWGVFSQTIKGRVGYQCSNYWRQMMKDGWVKDPNYWIRSDGSFQFKRAKKGSIPDEIRRFSFVVLHDPSKVFHPLPGSHPKRPSDAKLAKYLQTNVKQLDDEQKKGGKRRKAASKKKGKKNQKEKDEEEEEEEKKEGKDTEDVDEETTDNKVEDKKESEGIEDEQSGNDKGDEEESTDNTKSKKKKKLKSKKKRNSKKKSTKKKGKKDTESDDAENEEEKEKEDGDGHDAVDGEEEEEEVKGKKKKKKKSKSTKSKKKKKSKKKSKDGEDENDEESASDSAKGSHSKKSKRKKRKHPGKKGDESDDEEKPPQKKRKISPSTGEEKNAEEVNDNDPMAVLKGMTDMMTGEAMLKPAISPYGHVMEYDSWCSILRNPKTKNKCPFTQQKITRRQLVRLNEDNIGEYKDKIVNVTDQVMQSES